MGIDVELSIVLANDGWKNTAMDIHIVFQLCVVLPHWQKMANGATWNPSQK
jgi:hypothetical protein